MTENSETATIERVRWTRESDAAKRERKRWRNERRNRRAAKWCEDCR